MYLEGQRIGQAGLDEVPIAPGVACLLFRSVKCVAAQDDDADVSCASIGAEAAREVKSGRTVEAEVGNDRVRLDGTRASERILGVGHGVGLKSHDRQRDAVHVTRICVIVDDQHDR